MAMELKVGNRKISKVLSSLFKTRHYMALINMMRFYPDFFECFKRYFLGTGSYPYVITVKTPMGIKKINLYSYDDLLTVNEIFCREDYKVSKNVKTVCDVGSNIGISALYFLSRNNNSIVHLYEPLPQNLKRLKKNLSGYEERYKLYPYAVGIDNNDVDFFYEETGRYGGIGVKGMKYKMNVKCKEINSVVETMIGESGTIDVLKLDVEGMEIQLIMAIDRNKLVKIKTIFAEAEPPLLQVTKSFFQRQYGPILILENKSK